VHNFSCYIYSFALHVLGKCVSIIRRNNCIYATLGICCSVWMTVWSAGWNEINIFFLNRLCNSCGFWPAQLSLSILSWKVFTECRCQRHVKPPTWRTSD